MRACCACKHAWMRIFIFVWLYVCIRVKCALCIHSARTKRERTRQSLYICPCIPSHKYIHTSMHAYLQTSERRPGCIRTRKNTCKPYIKCILTYKNFHAYMQKTRTHKSRAVFFNSNACTCMHEFEHTHKHTHTHTHKRTYTFSTGWSLPFPEAESLTVTKPHLLRTRSAFSPCFRSSELPPLSALRAGRRKQSWALAMGASGWGVLALEWLLNTPVAEHTSIEKNKKNQQKQNISPPSVCETCRSLNFTL